MGIFDKIKSMFSSEKREQDKKTKDAISSVKRAAQASNYNQASIHAFQALEEIGKAYGNLEREIYSTAREYGQILADNGSITTEELEPIIINFEVAKYSPGEVTFDDYRAVEETLDTVVQKYKSPVSRKPTKTKAKKSKRKRKRPTKRQTGAGARKRQRK